MKALRITLLLLTCIFTAAVKADAIAVEEGDTDFELLDITIDGNQKLYESAEVLFYADEFLIPFQLVVGTLELNLQYEQSSKTITGTIDGDSVRFSLNGLSSDVGKDVYYVESEGLLYIETKALAVALDASVKVDFTKLTLDLVSRRGKFPIQVRLERENRVVSNVEGYTADEYNILIEDQYRLLTPPKARVQLSAANGKVENSFTSYAQVYGDVLYHQALLNLSKTDGSLTKRLTLSRGLTNPDEKILGVINRYDIGDVSANNLQSGSSYSGLGMTFVSFEEQYDNYFDKITIEESVPSGWEVELYRNGYLLEIGTSDANGRIRFDDIDANYGTNRFELKAYGPYGEVDVIYKEVIIGQQFVKKGSLAFSGGFFDVSRSVFESSGKSSSYAGFIQTEYGLTSSLSLGLSYYLQEQADDIISDNDYFQEGIVSLNAQFANSLASLNYRRANDDSSSISTSILGSWSKKTNYSLLFSQEDIPESQSKTQRALGSISTRINRLAMSLSSTYSSSETGGKKDFESFAGGFRVGSNLGKINLTNNINYQSSTNATGEKFETIQDQLSVSSRVRLFEKDANVRLTGQFTLGGSEAVVTGLDNLTASINMSPFENVYSSASISRDRNKNNTISVNAGWTRDDMNLVSSISHSDKNGWYVSLGVSFNIEYDYHRNAFDIQNTLGNVGSTLDLFSYIDHNKNAIFDEYDSPLPNVVYGPNSIWKDRQSDERGFVYLPNQHNQKPQRLTYDTSGTDYDNLEPLYDNLRFYSHTGGVITADIPFNYKSEVEGTIIDDSSLQAAKFTPLELIDHRGNVVKKVKTDLENYYYIDGLWAGKYRLRVEPGYLADRKLISVPESVVVDLTNGIDYKEIPEIVLLDEGTEIESTQSIKTYDDFVEPKSKSSGKTFEEFMREDAQSSTASFDEFIGKASAAALPTTVESVIAPVDAITEVVEPVAEVSENTLPVIETRHINITPDFFTVQFGVYNDREYCALRVEKMKEAGLSEAFYSLETGSCKVYAGEFSNQQQAEEFLAKIPKTLVTDSFTTVYRDSVKTYAIQIDSFAVQMAAMSKSGSCELDAVTSTGIKQSMNYMLEVGNYCKVYHGDFLSSSAAREALNTLPESVRRTAFVSKK